MQMTDPLGKLLCVGNGGRQEDIMNIVRKKDDGLFPNHTSLWKTQKAIDLVFKNKLQPRTFSKAHLFCRFARTKVLHPKIKAASSVSVSDRRF